MKKSPTTLDISIYKPGKRAPSSADLLATGRLQLRRKRNGHIAIQVEIVPSSAEERRLWRLDWEDWPL